MKKIIAAGLSILVLAAMAVPVLAQKELVGVQVGDWFKYKAEVTQWESTMEFLPENYQGPLIVQENQTDAIWYNVTTITPGDGGDNVTFTIQYDWTNGTVTYETMTYNVSTADQIIFMIGANMTAGDMVSDTFDFLNLNMFQYPARYINETIDFTNPNATRETNVLEYDINILGAPYEYIFYYDKTTGMRVWYWNHGDVPEITFPTGTQPAYEYTVVWELVDSSVEDLLVPDLTGPILLLTFMTITVPIVFLHRRKKLIT